MKAAAMFGAAILSFFGLQSGNSTPPSIPSNSCVNIERTLFIGSTGVDVSALQKFLAVKPTGYFGPATKQKLIEWQIAHLLIHTLKAEGAGTTGPKTRSAMHCSETVTSPTAVTIPTIVVPAATPTQTLPVQIAPAVSPVSGGGSGSNGADTSLQSSCPLQGAKPVSSLCTTGPWITVQDEGSCNVWFCSDPLGDLQG